jgi:hypothetical protein
MAATPGPTGEDDATIRLRALRELSPAIDTFATRSTAALLELGIPVGPGDRERIAPPGPSAVRSPRQQ